MGWVLNEPTDERQETGPSRMKSGVEIYEQRPYRYFMRVPSRSGRLGRIVVAPDSPTCPHEPSLVSLEAGPIYPPPAPDTCQLKLADLSVPSNLCDHLHIDALMFSDADSLWSMGSLRRRIQNTGYQHILNMAMAQSCFRIRSFRHETSNPVHGADSGGGAYEDI